MVLVSSPAKSWCHAGTSFSGLDGSLSHQTLSVSHPSIPFRCVFKVNMRLHQCELIKSSACLVNVKLKYYECEIPSVCFPVELQWKKSSKRGNVVIRRLQLWKISI